MPRVTHTYGDPAVIKEIMDKIVKFDLILNELREEVS
jgi:hypothetical protein